VIIDTGCSRTVTGFADDFVSGTLKKLSKPSRMDGIGGSLSATHEGQVHYEVINDSGEVSMIECTSLYMPKLQCRLYSPQCHFRELQSLGKPEGSLRVTWDKSVLDLPASPSITISYEHTTHLPVMQAYKNIISTAESLAMTGCVTNEVNQNLTYLGKLLLQWHFKLGHVGFSTVKWIGRQGILGKLGEKMGQDQVKIPKCAACQFGKQERNPKAGSTQIKDKSVEGSLKRNKLEPGELVFSDQYESRLPGRVFGNRGSRINSQKYKGGTLFCDAASSRVSIYNQISFTAEETITSKLKYEREAMSTGIQVQSYSSDNGIYTSKEFMRELHTKGQGIKHSGVGGHHHNGVAENSIKNVVRLARTMMIHAALRWPEVSEKELWPMAMQHAVHLHNHTPKISSGLSPEEVWSRSKSTHSALQNAHPWGCPVYVLDPRLQDGSKLPKWAPRSRRAQYLGASPLHASTVGLVRNLQTGNMSPQFHLVFDDYFETVHSDEGEEPAIWSELITFQAFRSDYDDEDYVPELSDEWLNPDALRDRQQQQQEKRRSREKGPTVEEPVDIPPDPGELLEDHPRTGQREPPVREHHL
jgi:hypothetical protein